MWVMLLLADSLPVAGHQSPAHIITLCFLGQGEASGPASVVELHFPKGWACAKPTAREGTTLPQARQTGSGG